MSEPEPKASRMTSVLGEKALVLGNVEGRGDLEIRGRVQGDVILEGRCSVTELGTVLGRLEALQLMVAGAVRGDLLASELISIAASAVIEGNVEAPRVEMEAGATVRGQLRTGQARDSLGEAHSAASVPARPRAPAAALHAPVAGLAPASLVSGPGFAPGHGTKDTLEPFAAAASGAPPTATSGVDEESSRPRRKKRRRRGGGRDSEPSDRDSPLGSIGPDPVMESRGAVASEESTGNVAGSVSLARAEPERSGREVPPELGARLPPRERSGSGGEASQTENARRPEREPRRGGGKGPTLPTFVKGARGHLRQ